MCLRHVFLTQSLTYGVALSWSVDVCYVFCHVWLMSSSLLMRARVCLCVCSPFLFHAGICSQDILAVMTDRLHKSGFKMHATLLRHMFQLVEGGHVTLELYDVTQHPAVTVRYRHSGMFFSRRDAWGCQAGGWEAGAEL